MLSIQIKQHENCKSFSTTNNLTHVPVYMWQSWIGKMNETAVTTCIKESSIRTPTRCCVNKVRDCKRQLLHTIVYVKSIETAIWRIRKKDWSANTSSSDINQFPISKAKWCLQYVHYRMTCYITLSHWNTKTTSTHHSWL